MKKLLIVMALVLQVFAVRAAQSGGDSSWLYWTLDLQDDWGNQGQWEKPLGVADGTYDVWLVAEKTATGEKVNYHIDEKITLSNGGTQGSIGESGSQVELQLADLSAYSFYSAIGAIGEGDVYTVAWTSFVRDYASLAGFIQTDAMSPADVWNTAVAPEPTSGLLLLLGVAGLALRRRKCA